MKGLAKKTSQRKQGGKGLIEPFHLQDFCHPGSKGFATFHGDDHKNRFWEKGKY
jgi:hypothetical protein